MALTINIVQAHEGHDHGPPAPALPTAVKPRVAIQTDLYELVGIADGTTLRVLLDRYDNNAPVTDATIEIVAGADTMKAEASSDGTYKATIAALAKPGNHDLIFNVSHKDGDDLLAGTLKVPQAKTGANDKPRAAAAEPLSTWTIGVWALLPVMLLGLALGFIAGRRRPLMFGLLAAALFTLQPVPGRAHEGHEPSPAPAGDSFLGDAPRRLPDGSVFLPKASQRLMSVRTQKASEGEANRGTMLVGRVIADPNRSGVVQSIAGGRVTPPDAGLPRLGQEVKKGEILAMVVPAIPLADQSTIAEKQRELEGDILLAEQKLTRLRKLGGNITPQSQIDDTALEIQNLHRRIKSLSETKIRPETLAAPIDGVISASNVVAGQVVQGQDVLFQIVDPHGLWVEAFVFDQIDPGSVVEASAVAPDKTVMKLKYMGRGRALQQQSILLQFAIETPPASAALGMPVTVVAKRAQTLKGMLLPRDALVKSTGGETIVWQHVDPERFVARPVRVEPFDGEQVLVTGGIADKDRVVVHGAELLAQVR
ncbi:MAG: efflux RND transporter periplasmic adaptor subunit [Hyphomonas sp.]|nr:efflux RND transporter periplasmic adaptor subunit [Hyphomonas sp.]